MLNKLRYLKWKIKTIHYRKKLEKISYNPLKTYLINPGQIKLSTNSPGIDRTTPVKTKKVTPMLERGKIIGGDWDIEAIPFEEMDVWKAFHSRFKKKKSWEETLFYKRIASTIEKNISLWGCKTVDEFNIRLKKIEVLYDEIKRNGYKSQADINSKNKLLKNEDEVNVHIGRNGQYIFGDGRHRLCIAKLLNIDKIPVKIARRHTKWVNFRKEILSYANSKGGKVYAPLIHPDLEDIPSIHNHDRMDIIKSHLLSNSGELLDIGAHWGYFSSRFAKIGFNCLAIEYFPLHRHFLNKLKIAYNVDFKIFKGSVFDFDVSNKKFEVTLALNIFHHFLKKKELFENLKLWLSKLDTQTLFFEPHSPLENQMKNSYINFEPDEFANFIKQTCKFKTKKMIGTSEDGRTIFMLTKQLKK